MSTRHFAGQRPDTFGGPQYAKNETITKTNRFSIRPGNIVQWPYEIS